MAARVPLDLVVAGTEEAILMVEAGANQITEAEILDALDIAHSAIKELCRAQHELRQQAGKDKVEITPPTVDESMLGELRDRFGAALDEATSVTDKLERQEATKRVEEEAMEAMSGDPECRGLRRSPLQVQMAFDKLEKDTVRKRIAVEKKRPDGRAAGELRDIWVEVGMAPRTHGSAIFTRRPDAGLLGRRARHHTRRDAARHARPAGGQALLPPLQLPAVLGGRGRLHARPEAA